jgi:hypothetical protein
MIFEHLKTNLTRTYEAARCVIRESCSFLSDFQFGRTATVDAVQGTLRVPTERLEEGLVELRTSLARNWRMVQSFGSIIRTRTRTRTLVVEVGGSDLDISLYLHPPLL